MGITVYVPSPLGASVELSEMADLTDGKILIGNASNRPTAVTPSGDVTISNAGTTTIGASKVTEAMQVLADNTTGNASTTAHGYLKKLDNTATNFMDGTGNWSAPAGGSGDTVFDQNFGGTTQPDNIYDRVNGMTTNYATAGDVQIRGTATNGDWAYVVFNPMFGFGRYEIVWKLSNAVTGGNQDANFGICNDITSNTTKPLNSCEIFDSADNLQFATANAGSRTTTDITEPASKTATVTHSIDYSNARAECFEATTSRATHTTNLPANVPCMFYAICRNVGVANATYLHIERFRTIAG